MQNTTNKMATYQRIFSLSAFLAVIGIFLVWTGFSHAASIKVVPSVAKATPGDSLYVDIVAENIPQEGLGAFQFRLNVSAAGSNIASVSDISQSQPQDVSVVSPLLVGSPTSTRSGLGDFFWNAKGSHGVLVMDNETLNSGSGLYTFGHTNGGAPPSGSGSIARFQIKVGSSVAAEKINITLTDVMLLDSGTEYPLDNNTGAAIELRCYTNVPELKNLFQVDAQAELRKARLSLGNIYEIDNSNGMYPLGKVLAQSFAAGAQVLCDSPVNLAINTAPDDITNVQAFDKAGDENGTVILSWLPSRSGDTAGYRVYLGTALLKEIKVPQSTGAEISGLPSDITSQLRITAFDTLGNESQGVIITATPKDDVPPVVTVNGAQDGLFYNTDVLPVINVFDANLASRTITLNNVGYTGSPITLEGAYTLTATAIDKAGNRTTKTITFTIDKTPPVITVAGVDKGRFYNTDLAPVITATDLNLDRVSSTLNGISYTSGAVITSEGAYELKIEAVDKAGNRATDTYAFYIDKTKPVSAITIGEPKFENANGIFVSGSTPFTLTGQDTGIVPSGIDHLEYRLNNTVWNIYQSPFTLTGLPDGNTSINYRAIDKAGNIEDAQTLTVKADTTPPATGIAISDPKFTAPDGTIYIGAAAQITLSATDNLSGVKATEYRIDAGASTAYASSFALSGEGQHIIYFRSTDNIGNTEPEKNSSLVLDITPPATTLSTNGAEFISPDGKRFITSSTLINLSATDNLSGVDTTEYKIDNGTLTVYTPFSIQAEGAHDISFRSKDHVGNLETFKSQGFIVDNTPPATEIIIGAPRYVSPDGKPFAHSNTQFTLSATDNLSGVKSTEYRIDGGAWTAYAPFKLTGDGVHTIEYRSTDNLNNIETTKSLQVIIDTTPPETTIIIGVPRYKDTSTNTLYATSAAILTLDSIDALSGVAKIEYRIDAGAWTAYTPFTLQTEGTHTISYRATDNIGNVETEKTLIVTVDNTPPQTGISIGEPKFSAADGTLYITSSSRITLSATDNLSGVGKTEYKIDNGAWIVYAPFTINSEGVHTIFFRSTDNVGNIEVEKTKAVVADNTPPATDITIGAPKYVSTDGRLYVHSNTQFTLSATDNLSGVKSTEYRTDNGVWSAYAPFKLTGDGNHTIEFRSTDNVGNIETTKSLQVIVDTTPPESSIHVGKPQYSDGSSLYVSSKTLFTIDANDALSGVARIEYQIDGGIWIAYTPFNLQSEGRHTITYRAIDNIGNTETEKSLTVTVDNTPPETFIYLDYQSYPSGNATIVSKKTSVSFGIIDNLSGVKAAYYRFDNETGWRTYTSAFTLAGLSFGRHTIHYYSIDNVENNEIEKTVEVILIAIDVKTDILNIPRVLVWTEELDDDDYPPGAVENFLKGALGGKDVYYAIVTDDDEFIDAFRSGIYNVIALLGEDMPEDAVFLREMREAVNRGMGIIASGWKDDTHPIMEDVFGVKFKGEEEIDAEQGILSLYQSPVSPIGTLATNGEVLKMQPNGGAVIGMVEAVFKEDKKEKGEKGKHDKEHKEHKKTVKVPGAVLNNYGKGKALFLTFDLLKSALHSNTQEYGKLLRDAANYLIPEKADKGAASTMLTQTSITLYGAELDLKAIDTLSHGLAYIPLFDLKPDPLEFTMHLKDGDKGSYRYFVRPDDKQGDYAKTSDIYIMVNGYQLFDTYPYAISILDDSISLMSKTRIWLSQEITNHPAETDKINEILSSLADIEAMPKLTRKDMEKVISHTVQAIHRIEKLSFDTSYARELFDEYLRITEVKWSLLPPDRKDDDKDDKKDKHSSKKDDAAHSGDSQKGPKAAPIEGAGTAGAVQVEIAMPDSPRFLIWFNECAEGSSQEDKKQCARQDLLENALKGTGAAYYIVNNKNDFQNQLRNSRYTDYIILGDKETLDEQYAKELKERVYSGSGLIASLLSDMNLNELSGIKNITLLSSAGNPVEFIESEIFHKDTVQSYGKALKIEAWDKNILGWITGTVKKKINKYPAVIKNTYGNGNALFFAFDLGLSVKEENYTKITEILKASLTYIHKPQDTKAFYPYDLAPVKIELKGAATALNLKATVSYPDDIKLTDDAAKEWVTDNPWEIEISLNADKTTSLNLFALTPDVNDSFTISTDISYFENGKWKSYKNLSLDIKVERDAYTLITDILYKLDTLYPYPDKEAEEAREAKRYIEAVKNRAVNNKEDMDKNISDMLKAIGHLVNITSLDIKDVRLDMDRLLKIWEERRYGGDAR